MSKKTARKKLLKLLISKYSVRRTYADELLILRLARKAGLRNETH